jgi:hypothetical protein
MKDLELLVPRVQENAPAAPEPTILRHLRDAAIEFCRRTRVWRSKETFTIGADGHDSVDVDPGRSIYEITHAAFIAADAEDDDDGTPLDPVTIDWLDNEHPGWRNDEGPPRWITQWKPNTVRVVPKPEAAGTLRLELILLPAIDADQVPDILIDSYSREIADGAIGSVLLLPAEFGNAQLGALHAGLFQGHLGRFGDRIPRGQQRSRRRTKPSSYF